VLAKKYLLNKKEVAVFKQRGKNVFRTPFFNVAVLKVSDEDIVKFSFVISKKVSGRAVERNKVKRLLAEIIRNKLDKFKRGFYIVFYIKDKMCSANYEEINNLVDKSISEISLA